MLVFFVQLLLLLMPHLNTGDFISTTGVGGGKNPEHEKYYSNHHKTGGGNRVPTLESLFQVVTYRDNLNSSSPCTHVGKRRNTECHRVVTFDRAGYEKSLQDTKRLILGRLNLANEPEVRLSKSKMNFIEQLENRLQVEQATAPSAAASHQFSIQKTKYDMKAPDTNKVLNSMHEAISVGCECGARASTSTLCMRFEIPSRIFQQATGGKTLSLKSLQRRIQSLTLWVYVKSSDKLSTTTMGGEDNDDEYEAAYDDELLNLRIENIKTHHSFSYKNLNDGWNTIDVKGLVDLAKMYHDLSSDQKSVYNDENQLINVTLALKCMSAECSLGYTDREIASSNVADESSNDDDTEFSLTVSNSMGKKPLLSVNLIESSDESISFGDSKAKNRGKRRTHHHHNGAGSSSGHHNHHHQHSNHHHNFKAPGLDPTYTPKLCYNNYPDANRECCLITYFVNFNSLKWSSWILSPSGFVANYCSGKCNDAKSNLFTLFLSLSINRFILFQASNMPVITLK